MLLDLLGIIVDALGLLSSGLGPSSSTSDRMSLNYDEKPLKKESKRSKYFTEKVSAVVLVLAALGLFIVFKDPLPVQNYTQTLIVASLIGIGISLLVFFVLYVLELYYFKTLFKLFLFSCSVIIFFISVVLYGYFKSGWLI
ncbi:glucan phosphoethanolaminetransferase (alkaline phosphatase superfamily) [Chryseobacterium vietnamense]|uniref:branched-chain amino acid ABC transporter substrate-binding protein n=1 Tax=Chryseobacterium vietnamense TaxID=866785 RepID=UPI002861C9DC|nr:branched-chain amino acid ABC transporter substrate-binding protein [Chryseobacterium vietnamense]MDR6485856.1 glucan phosphoethanolaminetransferase (alkaline phosphatase superfamily) [Chryseobacterium vietnamense]